MRALLCSLLSVLLLNSCAVVASSTHRVELSRVNYWQYLEISIVDKRLVVRPKFSGAVFENVALTYEVLDGNDEKVESELVLDAQGFGKTSDCARLFPVILDARGQIVYNKTWM